MRPPPPGAPNARRSGGHGAPTLGSLSLSPYVAIVCFNCFRRFRGMLQLNHIDVAKVDRGMLHMLQVF